ncbi:hypothetical protein Tco_1408066 [Tanacetum coccineum]
MLNPLMMKTVMKKFKMQSDEEIQDANVKGDKMNEEETNEEAKVDALYRNVNVNLEGKDTEMTDAPCTSIQTPQVLEDTMYHNLTPVNPEGQQQSSSVSSGFVSNMVNPTPNIGIDSFAEPPLISFIPKFLTSHAIAANLSELELKKILIDKIESNKSIHRSDEQKNLYKALADAYENDKLILDTYGDTVLFKRHRDDEDKDEEPSAGSNRGVQEKKSWKTTRVYQCTKGKDLHDNWQVNKRV